MSRIVEYSFTESCGCYTEHITDTWRGVSIEYDEVDICEEHFRVPSAPLDEPTYIGDTSMVRVLFSHKKHTLR